MNIKVNRYTETNDKNTKNKMNETNYLNNTKSVSCTYEKNFNKIMYSNPFKKVDFVKSSGVKIVKKVRLNIKLVNN